MFSNGELCSNPFTRMGSDANRFNTNGSFIPSNRILTKPLPENDKQVERDGFQRSPQQLQEISNSNSPLFTDLGSSQNSGSECLNSRLYFSTALPYPVDSAQDLEPEKQAEEDEDESPLFPNWNFSENGKTFSLLPGNNHTLSANLNSDSAFQSLNPFQRAQGWAYKSDISSQSNRTLISKENGATDSKDGTLSTISKLSPLQSDSRPKALLSMTEKETEVGNDLPIISKFKFFNQRFKLISIGLALIIVLTAIPGSMVFVGSSCRSNTGFCFPQFSMQLDDTSSGSKEALESARELFKVLSYVAIDLGTKMKQFEEENYLETVDTFSPENIYGMNFFGYCRDNLELQTRFCTDCLGMDVISTLVLDSGIQLAKVTKKSEFKIIGNSFVLAYKVLLNNIAEDKSTKLNRKGGFIDKLRLLNHINISLGVLTAAFICLSAFALLYFSIILLVILAKKPKFLISRLKLLSTLLVILECICFCLIFCICSIEMEYIHRINKFAVSSGIASIRYDLGMYIVELILIVNVLSFGLVCWFHRITK